MIVRDNGAVAWIACERTAENLNGRRTGCERPGRYAEVVRVAQPDGTREVLDRGRRINPSSLRLHGQTLHWRTGTRLRTAEL